MIWLVRYSGTTEGGYYDFAARGKSKGEEVTGYIWMFRSGEKDKEDNGS